MSRAQDERAVLETIAFGEKAGFAGRLKALEMLRTLDPGAEARDFYADLALLSEAELHREIDGFFACDIVRAIYADKPTMGVDPADFPSTAAVVRGETERWVREQRQRLEAEFQERLEAERARRLPDVSAEPGEEDAAVASGEAPSAPQEAAGRTLRTLPPPPGIDLDRGWQQPESTIRRSVRPHPRRIGR